LDEHFIDDPTHSRIQSDQNDIGYCGFLDDVKLAALRADTDGAGHELGERGRSMAQFPEERVNE